MCSLAAAELLARRNGSPLPAVRIHEGAVATAFTSERHLRIDGRAPVSFAPLSGFWRADDGWVRTHANYPHHRARLLRALGLPDTGDEAADAARLAAAVAALPARTVQERVYAAGGLAVATAPERPARAAREPLPLVETDGDETPGTRTGTGAWAAPRAGARAGTLSGTGGRDGRDGPARPLPPAELPADGVRVLDLTRVIAGPVATRTLALLGADVLRVDSPRLPEDPGAHADTGLGKRSTLLGLAVPADRETFGALLASADILVTGYRPGALDRFGLSPAALRSRHPRLIVAQLSAWGRHGPWAGRRGFDSLVQAATGIAAAESGSAAGTGASAPGTGTSAPGTGTAAAAAGGDVRPGVLPAQALDHGTGYLLAAAVLRALTERELTGRGRTLRLSLAGTASWLLHGIRPGDPPPPTTAPYDPAPWLTETDSPHGTQRHALPPVGYAGAPVNWPHPPGPLGADPPRWAPRTGP
ncbi:carnitine dehydratase [Streptomyces sp. PLAI1-29]|uniref:Carnitine dehydratase n=1 Tax=Streptomyces zingiberis TaxID=2053010 RepID=A0ABX1BU06_9ACTN|nr:carnitine dehydratase [Streptomyces zingiberis]